VDHHGEIHVVEVAQAQEFGLTPKKFQRALARLSHPPLDVAVFLRGHREEDHAAGQVLGGLGVHEAHGRAQHPRHLGVVATGVGRSGLGVGLRMAGDHQTVQLSEHGERRAFAGAPGQIGAHAGEGESALRGET
jgi:hypothetical protein